MRFGDKLAINIAPLFLRLALAITFLWAGWGKLGVKVEFQPEQAAILANMGAFTPENAPYSVPEAPSTDGALPDPTETGEAPASEEGSAAIDGLRPSIVRVVQEAQPADEAPAGGEEPPAAEAEAPPAPTYTAEDFSGPVTLRQLHNLALLIHNRSQPLTREDGTTTGAIVPEWAASGNRPIVAAWLGAVTELVAAGLLIIGFFSRLSGFALAGTMVVAMALTTIGPAIQAGTTTLGFIPNPSAGLNWYEPAAYSTLLWQLALFCAGMALFCTGSGTLALDRIFRKKSPAGGDDDDE